MKKPGFTAALSHGLLTGVLLGGSLLAQQPAGEAQEPAPAVGEGSTLTTTEAQSFLGYWMLTARLGERDTKMGLILRGEGTLLTGRLVSGFGEMTGENFRRAEERLQFDLVSGLGRFGVEVWREGSGLKGRFADESGSISADLSGTETDRVALERFMIPANETRITRGEQMVRLRFATPRAEGRDFEQIETLEPGSVVRFLEFPVTKLMTDLNLQFGELVVPIENITDDYPGVYGLWLKRTEAGWNLVFNHKADVWGTQYDSEADHGEVPLVLTTAAEPSEQLVAELDEGDDGRLLRLIWGPHAWSVPFQILSE